MGSARRPGSSPRRRSPAGATNMGTRRTAPDGLDYVPIAGTDPNFVFGVIRATLGGSTTTALDAVFRRLFPVAQPSDPEKPWPQPTCFKWDVLLPPWASADYLDPQTLCRAYGAQGWDGVKDLVVIASFRMPETVSEPPTMSVATAFELVRSYCYQKLATERKLATVVAMHLPGRAGSDGLPPHAHAMALARELGPAGFGSFVRPLATDAGRKIIETEWAAWRVTRGAPASGGKAPKK